MQPREAWPKGSVPRGLIIREAKTHPSPWEPELWTHFCSPRVASASEAAASERLLFTQRGRQLSTLHGVPTGRVATVPRARVEAETQSKRLAEGPRSRLRMPGTAQQVPSRSPDPSGGRLRRHHAEAAPRSHPR